MQFKLFHMKILTFTVFLFSFLSLDVHAQFPIGDVEVSSFKEIFNPDNKTLWHPENERGIRMFKVDNSGIWNAQTFSRLLLKKDGKSSATFMTEDDKTQDFWNKEVLKPIREQFGRHQEVTIEDPFVIGEGQEIQMKKWIHSEDGNVYEIFFGDLGGLTGLIM